MNRSRSIQAFTDRDTSLGWVRRSPYPGVRAFTWVLMIGIAGGMGGCRKTTAPSTEKAASRGWDVLLITFDTTRWDRFSCYGNRSHQTPTVDELARNGVRYTRCYSPVPITLPSHTSMMTGLYPFRHRLHDNGMGPLDERFMTLAEVLKGQGYQTGAVIGALVLDSRFGLDQGFDRYDDEFGEDARPSSHIEIAERQAEAVTDAALQWLTTSHTTSPFFLWVHYFDPHMPYAPPGLPPNTPYNAAYDQEIVYADAQLGRLMQAVSQRRAATQRETLILFTADHGESLMEHGEPTHAFFAYDVTIRVPLVVSIPGMAEVGKTVEEPVSLVDLYPSVLHWLGIAAPYQVDGSVWPLPGQAPYETRRALYLETRVPFHFYGWSPLEGVVSDRYKFILAPRPELYDLVDDPRETRNLFTTDSERAVSLREALDTLKASSIDAPTVSDAELTDDAESIRALRALGYAGEIREPPSETSGLADPKDMIAIHVDFTSAATSMEKGELARAVREIERGLQADPDNPRGMRLLTELLDKPEGSEGALSLARRQLERPLPEPFDRRLPITLGLALARQGRGGEAVELLRPLAEAHPDSAELRHGMALSYLSMEQPDRAIAELAAAIEADGSFRPARVLMGDLYVGKGEFNRAVEAYSIAAGLGEPSAEIHVKWAESLRRAGRGAEAGAQYARAVELDEKNPAALVGLAELAVDRGDPGSAIDLYDRAAAAQPDDASLRYSAGVAHLQAGQWPAAIKQLREAVRLQPDYGDALINLGVALFKGGNSDAAIEAFRSATAVEAVAAQARFNLGLALARNQRTAEAIVEYEKALELRPTYEAAVDELSANYLSLGQVADAVRVWRIGASNVPGNIRFVNTLAHVLASSRDDRVRNGAEAVRFAEQACRATGYQHAAVLGTLAAAYAEAGDFKKAIETAERAMGLVQAGAPPEVSAWIQESLAGYRESRPYRDPRF